MDFTFKAILAPALVLVTASGCARRTAPAPAIQDDNDAQRLASLVDYLGGDYGGAVRDGQILVQSEYEEQVRFASDAHRLGVGLVDPKVAANDPLLARLVELERLVHTKADPQVVAAAARDAREEVVKRFALPTVPTQPPSLARAESLYREGCVVCHGAKGDADTERAHALDPPPANFRDPARLDKLSPFRAYNALTFGVPGTSMPSFELLPTAERWDLAFYVLRLGHDDEGARGPVALTLADMATHNDGEILERLRTEGAAAPSATLAYARREAAFAEPAAEADIDHARNLVQAATRAFVAGRTAEADRLAIDAYLQGFEPLEAGLRARDPDAVPVVEAAFADFRRAMARQGVAEVRARGDALDAVLGRVGGSQRPIVPFSAAALIFFREGIEAALLIAALLAAVRKLGWPGAARYVHAGWVAALPASAATWWVFDRVVSMGADRRELMEGVIALVAAAVLFSVSFWMIAKAESRHWIDTLTRHAERGVNRRSLAVLAGLSFLALYREGAETILFTQALILESGARAQVWSGAAVGTVAVMATALLLGRTVRRLPLRPFFAVSGTLLCGLAVSFAGAGMHVLVASGYLQPRPVPFPEIPWMGIHPDLSGLLVQLVIVSVVAAGAVVGVLRSHTASPE